MKVLEMPSPDTAENMWPAEDLMIDRYRQLFDTDFGRMQALARLLGADDPEDIAQEAFVRLHGKLAGLRDTESARAYLHSIVVNLTRSRIRHLMTARRLNTSRGLHLVRDQPSAESVVVNRGENNAIVAALQHLPRRQREAIVLRFWLDLQYTDVAKTLGVSDGAAKSFVSRGLAALRTAVAQIGEDR